MLVLDTDIVSLLQYPETTVAMRLTERLVGSGQTMAVTIVTFEEQLRGRLAECARAKTPEAYASALVPLQHLLRDYQTPDRVLLPFDERAVSKFKELKTAKVRIGTMDLRIAAVALANDAALITRNLADYRKVPGLRAEDWTTGAGGA